MPPHTHMRLVMRSYNTAPRDYRRLMLGGPERPEASRPCAVRAPESTPPAPLASPHRPIGRGCTALVAECWLTSGRAASTPKPASQRPARRTRGRQARRTRAWRQLWATSALWPAHMESRARSARSEPTAAMVRAESARGARRCDRAGVLEPQAGSPVRVQARVRVTWLVTWQGAWVTWRRARATWPHASAYCSRRRQVRRAQLQWVWALQRPASTY